MGFSKIDSKVSSNIVQKLLEICDMEMVYSFILSHTCTSFVSVAWHNIWAEGTSTQMIMNQENWNKFLVVFQQMFSRLILPLLNYFYMIHLSFQMYSAPYILYPPMYSPLVQKMFWGHSKPSEKEISWIQGWHAQTTPSVIWDKTRGSLLSPKGVEKGAYKLILF